jgi:glycine/D-amino acid oxidase-like deaminating enzyme
MGASLAYFLTRKGAEGDGKRVVLVEAKDVASGACAWAKLLRWGLSVTDLRVCRPVVAGRNGGQ